MAFSGMDLSLGSGQHQEQQDSGHANFSSPSGEPDELRGEDLPVDEILTAQSATTGQQDGSGLSVRV